MAGLSWIYTTKYIIVGNYSCYITTYNDYGLADSGRIYFTVYENKPGYARVSLDRVSYKIGEDVVFKLESDTGNSYTVGIDDANGNRLYTQGTNVNLDTTTQYYTHIFDTAGQYSCYITTYNDIGLADSERIYFSIYDDKPKWAKVSVNSDAHGGNIYKIGQDIHFNLSSDTGYSYTVGIDTENDDGTRNRIDTKQVASNEGPVYTRSFDASGNYSCYITTYNDYGLADSERIFFKIYDSKPDWAKVTINSDTKNGSVYDIDENIHFNLTSNTGFSYTVGIDSENGERKRIDTQQIGIDDLHTYTRSFSEPGKYSCYITTYNDYGLADSERIFFTISPEGDCNADGSFNVSDVVMLQKWLLAVPNTNLENWKSADLCVDGKLDVFDLVMMKRKLIAN